MIRMLDKGRANVVIDGQWGSTGKGKLIGWIAKNQEVDLAVGDNMPNAGHTFVGYSGDSIMLKQIPVCAVAGVECLLGPHSVVNPSRFLQEIGMLTRFVGSKPRVFVDPPTTARSVLPPPLRLVPGPVPSPARGFRSDSPRHPLQESLCAASRSIARR